MQDDEVADGLVLAVLARRLNSAASTGAQSVSGEELDDAANGVRRSAGMLPIRAAPGCR